MIGPFQVSDHRPVGCYFLTSVCQVDEVKKEEIFLELLNDLQEDEPDWGEKYYVRTQMVDSLNYESPKKMSRKVKGGARDKE